MSLEEARMTMPPRSPFRNGGKSHLMSVPSLKNPAGSTDVVAPVSIIPRPAASGRAYHLGVQASDVVMLVAPAPAVISVRDASAPTGWPENDAD
jgi:hypothetical protein